MTHFDTLAEVLIAGDSYGPESDVHGTIEGPVEIGRLKLGIFRDVIDCGRRLGLNITVHEGRGWLSRMCYYKADGDWPALRTFVRMLGQLESDDN